MVHRQNNMRKLALATILTLVVLLAGCAAKSPGVTGASTVEWNGEVKEFNIRAFQFGFDPKKIEVNLGDKVRITAYSSDVPHGIAIPGYGVYMKLMDETPVSTEFIADRPGYYSFYCSIPCGSGHGAMRGELIVNE